MENDETPHETLERAKQWVDKELSYPSNMPTEYEIEQATKILEKAGESEHLPF